MKSYNKTNIEKICKGDLSSFSELYEALNKPTFTIIFRIVKDYHLAEDIMQDLFVKLFISPPDSSVKNLRAYIFQMARNLAIDALRKKSNMFYESIEECDASSDSDIDSFLFGMDLEKAMMKLDIFEREIITLHLNCDLTFFEISKIINLSVPSVYRRYCKGLKKLKNELNGDSK